MYTSSYFKIANQKPLIRKLTKTEVQLLYDKILKVLNMEQN